MQRYHKKVYFPENSKVKLKNFTDRLNTIDWQYTKHSIDNLKWRCYDIKDILLFIKALKLNYSDVFEYYVNNTGDIIKAVYRTNYKGIFDLCLVVDDIKNIVTIYVNSLEDKHNTLDKNLYVKK